MLQRIVAVLSRTSRRRLLTASGSIVVVAAAIFAVSTGKADSAARTNPEFGSLWLASYPPGSVTLLDGTVAQASHYRVRAVAYDPVRISGGSGHPLQVAQVGATAYVADPVAGSVTRVDGSTFTLTARSGFGQNVAVLAASQAVYAVDPADRVITQLDPATLSTVTTISTGLADPLTGSAAIDRSGALWWIDPTLEKLRVIRGGKASTLGSVPAGTQVALAGGHPVLFRPTQPVMTVTQVNGDGSLGRTVSVSGVSDPQVSASSDQDRVFVSDAHGKVLEVDPSSGAQSVVLTEPDHKLLAPVEAAGAVYVPDLSDHDVVAVDAATHAVRGKGHLARLDTSYAFQANDNGVVYFNDPDGQDAGVLSPTGAVLTTNKNSSRRAHHDSSDGTAGTPNTTPKQGQHSSAEPGSSAPKSPSADSASAAPPPNSAEAGPQVRPPAGPAENSGAAGGPPSGSPTPGVSVSGGAVSTPASTPASSPQPTPVSTTPVSTPHSTPSTPTPKASVSASADSATTCLDSTVTFTATAPSGSSITGVSWTWSDGGPQSASGTPSPGEHFSTAGQVTVTAMVTFDTGQHDTETLTVDVQPCGYNIQLSAASTDTCAGDTVQATVTSSGAASPVSSTTWTISPSTDQDTVASSADSDTVQFDKAQTYTFSANVTAQDGSHAQPNLQSVTVSGCASTVTLTSSSSTTDTCNGSTVSFSIQGTHPRIVNTQYSSSDGESVDPGGTHFSTAGNATVTADITYANGSHAAPTAAVRVWPCLSVTVDPDPNGTVTIATGGHDCSSPCTVSPDSSSGKGQATLNASAHDGYHLRSWKYSQCSDTSLTCTVTLTDQSPTAHVQPSFVVNQDKTITTTGYHTGSGQTPTNPEHRLYFTDTLAMPADGLRIVPQLSGGHCEIWKAGSSPPQYDSTGTYGACGSPQFKDNEVLIQGWVHVYGGLFDSHSGSANVYLDLTYVPKQQPPGS